MRSSRRELLRQALSSSSLVALGGPTIPLFLGRSARAAADAKSGERVLVVVQLLGGNDGLNTVVPFKHDGYRKARRRLRLPSGQLHKVNDEIALHPAMGRMAELLEQGRLSIVQGVGYPNPDRSHFRSMEIWETARTEAGPEALATGWLGRAVDSIPRASGADSAAMHIGGGPLPLGLRARQSEAPSLESLEQFRLTGASSVDPRSAVESLTSAPAESNPLLGFVRRTTLTAYDASRRLESMGEAKGGSYPETGLGRRLRVIGSLIKAGFGTRIYYTALDGFDTHANQLGSHAALLGELSDSLGAFHADLASAGQADRVVTLAFSEFGRRVAENASDGTDHGAAAPVFLMGPVAQPGLVGAHPSFDNLDDGDFRHHTDFRRVYASLLDRWLGLNSRAIVGPGFEPLPLLPASRS